MQQHDPYQAPQAAAWMPTLPPEVDEALAGRWERLAAALLDGVLMCVVVLPVMYFGGFFSALFSALRDGEQMALGLVYGWAAVSFILFVAVQGYPLYRSGQTWGKKLTGIRIVDRDGDVPPLGQLLLMRYFIGAVLTRVPFLGSLYGLVDSLFIFREDRRCIHDLIAGTRVVVAR
jgi:uncharacterized RDD family membrane protein YckC